jgi:flagellar protein FlaG
VEIQGLPLLNVNLNKSPSQAKSRKLDPSSDAKARSSQTEEKASQQTEVLISVSNTVADSNGINLSTSRLSFSQDKDTGDTVINIIDNKSGDVIRQIPPDEILELKKRIGEIQGLLLDRKV